MKRDIARYVSRCLVCQQIKVEHAHPARLLQPLDAPEWKWERMTMDFVVGLPRSAHGNEAIWVIVNRLTKSAHFLPVKMSLKPSQLAKIYVIQIVRLHGVPKDIISDCDPRLVSHF